MSTVSVPVFVLWTLVTLNGSCILFSFADKTPWKAALSVLLHGGMMAMWLYFLLRAQ